MHTLTDWNAMRSGPAMRLRGRDPGGNDVRLTVAVIEGTPEGTFATDRDGNRIELIQRTPLTARVG